jgi:uncharacterized protein (DUF1800 family)
MPHRNPSTAALIRYLLWVGGSVIALILIASQADAQTSMTVAQGAGAGAQRPTVDAGSTMSFDDARHLLNRTSFAAQPKEIAAYSKLTRAEAVDRLLSEARRQAGYPAPVWAKTYERTYRPEMTVEQRQEAQRREQVVRALELRTWWTAEMLSTPTPLTEVMTLFWHNHFATSQAKVRTASLMYRQNVMLRQHALGNFAVMLRDVAKDPAMLIYLDTAQNKKGAANENFAREVMELFTLGEGNYSEQDIKEVARAFTGWSFDQDAGEFRFRRAQHDEGVKTIFGQSGKFTGDDVVTLLLKRPQTSEFIVGKLWREFVSPELNTAEIHRIARVFREANYEIKPMLRAMLLAEDFWAAKNRAVLVKSPVDLVVGSLRQFQFEVEDPAPFAVIMRQLGQDLFGPPNVKGWPGGEAWLNTTTLLARKGFANRLFRADEMGQTSNAAAALIDRDLTGQGRQRAQMRLATNQGMNVRQQSSAMNDRADSMNGGTTMQDGKAGTPAFGVSNNLKGQYFFDATKWLAQYPNQSDAELLWKTLLAGPPVQVAQLKYDLAGLRAIALDPMYQLK